MEKQLMRCRACGAYFYIENCNKETCPVCMSKLKDQREHQRRQVQAQ